LFFKVTQVNVAHIDVFQCSIAFVRRVADDNSILQFDDAVCIKLNQRFFMTDKNDQTRLADLLDDAHDFKGVIGVKITCWLIRKHYLGIFRDGPGDGNTLLLSPRKGLDIATAIIVHPDTLKDIIDPLLDLLFVVKSRHVQTDLNVLIHRFIRQ
jgi:hypothetical protein